MDNLLNINMFDAVVIGLIVLLSLKGLLSGFTKELFGAIAIIGGLFTATFFNKDLAQYINSNLYDGLSIKLLELLSLIAIFIVVWFVVGMIYKIISSFSSDDYIYTTSRLGGMIVKMLTLFFVFSLIVYGLSSKPQVTEKFKDTLQSSKLYPLLKSSGAAILNAPSLVGTSRNSAIQTDSNETATTAVESNTTKTKESVAKEPKAEEKTVEKTETKAEEKTEVKSEVNSTTDATTKDSNSTDTKAKTE